MCSNSPSSETSKFLKHQRSWASVPQYTVTDARAPAVNSPFRTAYFAVTEVAAPIVTDGAAAGAV